VRIRVKGLKVYRSKDRTYAYHRATGTRILAEPGTAAFFLEIEQLNNRARKNAGTIDSWSSLVAAYTSSPKFDQELQPRTKQDYLQIFEWLRPLDGLSVQDWDRGFVIKLRDRAHQTRNWRFANYVVSVVSAVFTWAVKGDLLAEHLHPVRKVDKIKRPKTMPDANRAWSDAEWNNVIQAAPAHLLAPLLLCGVLGWREGEAIKRPRSDYDPQSKIIRRISSKSGLVVETPVPTEIACAIGALFPHDCMTLLVSSKRRPWTEDGFRTSIFKFLRRLEAKGLVGPNLTVHGLRHTVATRMREQGFDLDTIKDMLGQKTIGMAAHYSKRADLRKKLEFVVSGRKLG
jgi:integrase